MNTISGQATIDLAAAPTTVYDYLADFTRHPEWVANVSKVTALTSGPVRVGSRYRASEGPPPVSLGRRLRSMVHFIRGLIGGSKSYSEAEITTLEPGRRIAWAAQLPAKYGAFNRVDWEILLASHNGGTRLTQSFVWKPQTPAARQMIAALGDEAGIAQACLVSLRQLKAILERSASYLPSRSVRPVEG